MNEQQENDKLSRDQLANLLYNESQYRHTLLWSITKFYIILITSLYSYPLVSMNTDTIQKHEFKLLIFPVLAILITFIGWWHIKSEADRYDVVWKKYNEIRGIENKPRWLYDDKERTLKEQLVSEKMNELLLSLYFILSLILFLFGTLFIIDTSFKDITIHRYIYMIALFIPSIFIIIFFIKYNNKKREYNANLRSAQEGSAKE